ncbi:dicarboxylate/amino acid:cation symporter [Hirschia baltica]|uniref:Sodium:dicarboxylate symporter n=1 Tax=Hirschia baltica (strain ATCC 49814 / DSM 5838 / IFAM 1418) TaxID=582402 RepID=C6XKY9_HIRBI|nr:dicarboxylate/amino acid:cation symporter [Hirschia baltica]ACT57818.1 sodium:dicarboxylate symporter [Hirschia baltica ATCC 49814]
MGGWLKITLWKRVMLGLVLGILLGLGLHYGVGETGINIATDWIYPFGKAFINLIKMLVVPLIFTTLVSGVTAMGDPAKLGSLGGRALGLYMGTTLIAVTIGLSIGTLVQPGAGFDLGLVSKDAIAEQQSKIDSLAGATKGLGERLLEIIPTNPVAAFTEGNTLQIIFFAIIFGVGCLLAKEAGKPIATAVESAADVMMKITHFVMELAPFGVFALMTWVMANQGLQVLTILGKMVFAHYLACSLHMIITHGGIVKGILKLPLIRFFRGVVDAQAVAFSTSSSSATLPVTITCAEQNLGVSKSIASSVLPLGATINMDGTALYQGLIALFAAQAFGIQLDLVDYAMVAMTATLVSVGTAGIPSVSLFLATTTLAVIGCTPDQIVIVLAVLFPFDRLLDMMRTVTNVTGDVAVAATVAKWEGELDEDTFKRVSTV